MANVSGSVAYLVAVLLSAAHVLGAGQDANWDLQNYHLYAPYALLNGRTGLDVGPGGFQTYLNPLPYLIPYLATRTLPPFAAAVCVACLQAVVVPLVWALAGRIPALAGRPVLRAVATLAGCTSATAISEIGTSFADLQLAALVVGGLLALLQANERACKWRWLLAGALIGAATGLKLTNGVYVAGFLAALLLPWRGGAAFAGSAAVGVAGVAAGFALTGGLWALHLWQAFDSPVFPVLNTVFKSASAASSDFADRRFLPTGVWHALSYPWAIAVGEHPSAEVPFRDARLAIGLPAAGLAFALALRRGRRGGADPLGCLGSFLLASYGAWLLLFSIERYAVALEILAGFVAVALCAGVPGRLRTGLALGVAALLVSTTRAADWWHRPWDAAYRPSLPAALAEDAVVLTVSHPTGYWAALLPPGSRAYSVVPMGLATGGVLRARIVAGLAAAPGQRVWTLGADVPFGAEVRGILAGLGYTPAGPCVRAESFWWVETAFCRAAPAGPRRLAAGTLPAGQAVRFTAAGTGRVFEVSGFGNASESGTPTVGPSARLAFFASPDGSAQVLEIGFATLDEPASVAVRVNGVDAAQWDVPAAEEHAVRTLCLPGERPNDGVYDIAMTADRGGHLGLGIRSMQLRAVGPSECPR